MGLSAIWETTMRATILTLTLTLVLLAAAAASAFAAPADDAKAWADVEALLTDPDQNRERLFQALAAYRAGHPNGPRVAASILWTVKLNTDFSDDFDEQQFLPALDDILASAAEQSVQAEALFWKAHVLHGTNLPGPALDAFREYLTRFPDAPRRSQVQRILEASADHDAVIAAFLDELGKTIDALSAAGRLRIGGRLEMPAYDLRADFAIDGSDAFEVLFAAPWLKADFFIGEGGVFIALPEKDRALTYPKRLFIVPQLTIKPGEFTVNVAAQQNPGIDAEQVVIDKPPLLDFLKKSLARNYLERTGKREFAFLSVEMLLPAPVHASTVMRFDRHGILDRLISFDDRGEPSVMLTKLTLKPRVRRRAARFDADKTHPLSLNELSIAGAGKFVFDAFETAYGDKPEWADLAANREQIFGMLALFDQMLSQSLSQVGAEEELAQAAADAAAAPSDPEPVGRSVKHLTTLQRFDDAEQGLAEFKKRGGDKNDALLLAADLAVAQGDPAAAKRLLAAELDADAPSPALIARYAEIIGTEDMVSAALLAKRAIELDPSETRAYRVLATVKQRQTAYDQALAVLERGVAAAAKPDELRLAQAALHLELQQTDAAQRAIQPILDGPPGEQTAASKMVALLIEMARLGQEKDSSK
jgi:hypothetical protein